MQKVVTGLKIEGKKVLLENVKKKIKNIKSERYLVLKLNS